MDAPVFVLIHSPLVGLYTWALAAEALRGRGFRVFVPDLHHGPGEPPPFWALYARAVSDALRPVAAPDSLILAGHSGAGPLLPAIRRELGLPVSAYLFVDAGLPKDGNSLLDNFPDPEGVEQFRQAAVEGFVPPWTAEDLREVIPADGVRDRFAAELRPLPLAVYEEPLPVFAGWPDAPCGYLRFGDNPAYDGAFRQAQERAFETLRLEGAHFHMLVDPQEVAGGLVELARRLRALPA